MSPLYDFHCHRCDQTHEVFYKMADKPKTVLCPECGGESVSHPSIGAILGDEAAWLNSVTEVVDKNGGEHCQRFIADPTRDNYKKWMKGSGVRPMEPGEERRSKPTKADKAQAKQQGTDRAMKTLHESRKIKVS